MDDKRQYKMPAAAREYHRNYAYQRFHNDPEYREAKRARNREAYRRRQEYVKALERENAELRGCQ